MPRPWDSLSLRGGAFRTTLTHHFARFTLTLTGVRRTYTYDRGLCIVFDDFSECGLERTCVCYGGMRMKAAHFFYMCRTMRMGVDEFEVRVRTIFSKQ